MENKHTSRMIADVSTDAGVAAGSLNGSGSRDVEDRITTLLDELERMVNKGMSRPRVDRTLGLLGRVQASVASLMCDLTRVVAASDPEVDTAEMLRQGTRLPGREAKRMAKVARQLSDMPKVAERLASGHITLDHATALVNAAEKVGPEAVEADDRLLESADDLPADTFGRRARDWSNRKLIEAGVDPFERQRRARKAKVWVDKESGLGVLLAKLPAPLFAHVSQAIDARYLQQLRQDATGGRDPDEVRTPKQRLADVVFELLTNRDAVTGEFMTETVVMRAKVSTQVIVTAPIDVVDGTNPDGQCEIIGVGPVPRRILQTLSPDTESGGMIFDRAGRPPLVGPPPAPRQRPPASRSGHTRRGMLRMRRPHASLRAPPHPRMAPRRWPNRCGQPGRGVPSSPQMARNREPRGPTHPQRVPGPPPRRPRPPGMKGSKPQGLKRLRRVMVGHSLRFREASECISRRTMARDFYDLDRLIGGLDMDAGWSM